MSAREKSDQASTCPASRAIRSRRSISSRRISSAGARSRSRADGPRLNQPDLSARQAPTRRPPESQSPLRPASASCATFRTASRPSPSRIPSGSSELRSSRPSRSKQTRAGERSPDTRDSPSPSTTSTTSSSVGDRRLREAHAGVLRADHSLHQDAHAGGPRTRRLQIGRGALAGLAGETLLDRPDQLGLTDHLEARLVLTGKGELPAVLAHGGGAHRHRERARAGSSGQLGVGIASGRAPPRRSGSRSDPPRRRRRSRPARGGPSEPSARD